ncbi:hypothetical protein ACTZWT_23630 [Rhodopseudomonas sp. NSM]|uniref:hypothetical protein n=1 Tax=Rhodopseudomonas sp. NSM TaxID=3457630 RepID=UPI004036FD85
MVALLGILFGAVLGTRYKVFILIPTAMLGLAAIAVHGIVAQGSLGVTLQTMLGLILGLQIGYVFGLAVRATTAAARLRVAPAETVQSRPLRIASRPPVGRRT